jgi:acyl-CoA reductase-like NAD-dependent aldehyde dehydrogenase
MGTHPTPKIPSPFANEPFHDFSSGRGRQAMEHALKTVRGPLDPQHSAIISGLEVDGAGLIRSVNPARPSQLIGTVASGGPEDGEAAVRASGEAFSGWRSTPPERRSDVLFQAAEIVPGRRLELAALIVLEAGCSDSGRSHSLSRDAAELDFYFYEPRGWPRSSDHGTSRSGDRG